MATSEKVLDVLTVKRYDNRPRLSMSINEINQADQQPHSDASWDKYTAEVFDQATRIELHMDYNDVEGKLANAGDHVRMVDGDVATWDSQTETVSIQLDRDDVPVSGEYLFEWVLIYDPADATTGEVPTSDTATEVNTVPVNGLFGLDVNEPSNRSLAEIDAPTRTVGDLIVGTLSGDGGAVRLQSDIDAGTTQTMTRIRDAAEPGDATPYGQVQSELETHRASATHGTVQPADPASLDGTTISPASVSVSDDLSQVPTQPHPYPDYPASYQYASATGRTNGAVLLRFDDGYAVDFTDVLPELESRGLTGSFGIVPDTLGGTNTMTWDQVRELKRRGMSTMAHLDVGTYPGNITDVALEQWHEDTLGINGVAAFRDNNVPVQGFIKPGSATIVNNNVNQFMQTAHGNLIRQAYDLINLGEIQQPSIQTRGPPIGGPVFPQESHPASLAEALDRLEDTTATGGVSMFLFHGNRLTVGNDWLTWADFLTLLDEIEARVEAGNLDCVSPAHMAFTNANVRDWSVLSNGGFELGALGKQWTQAFGTPNVVADSTVTFAAAEGTHILDATVTGSHQLAQARIPTHGHDQYEVRAKFRAAAGTATGRMQVKASNGTGSYVQYACDDTGWTEAREVVGRDNDTKQISLWVGHLNGDGGVYVDDVQVHPL